MKSNVTLAAINLDTGCTADVVGINPFLANPTGRWISEPYAWHVACSQ